MVLLRRRGWRARWATRCPVRKLTLWCWTLEPPRCWPDARRLRGHWMSFCSPSSSWQTTGRWSVATWPEWPQCLHHCCSQGMPFFRPPSILTPGQFAKKYLASSHEVIWEQYIRPSQVNPIAVLPDAVGSPRLLCVSETVCTALRVTEVASCR